MPTDQPTAFVFAGGGSFGAVQVGQLRALVAHGLKPDMVVGSSVGAMNAAYYAGAPSLEGVERLTRIWRNLRRGDVFPLGWRTALGFARRRDFLVGSEGLRRLVHRHLPYGTLQEAKIPLHIVATDILNGEAVVLSQGPAAEAILASTAIPAAFAPVRLDGRYLADGAITSCTPVKVAVERGATRLIVLPTGYACAREAPPRGAVANALHALNLLITRQITSELESLDAGIDYYVAPPLCPLLGSPYDFSQTEALIERAAAGTQAWLAEGGLAKRGIPMQLRPHAHSAVASR
ncbi:MAG: patatin-like phospholipase family protein [Methyloceanibacter sp.]